MVNTVGAPLLVYLEQAVFDAKDHICLGDICTHGNFISVTEATGICFPLQWVLRKALGLYDH